MTSVESQIQAAASRNNELLSILSETDYAPPALDQQNRYIKDLENELKQLSSQISKLEKKREKELKDHEKYRDSVMKRYAYKLSRKTEKFEAKASKEEQEYFAVLQEEHQAKEAKQNTEHTLKQAQHHQTELQTVTNRHKEAQKSLDDLYDSIFEGPTPGFQDEDAKESTAHHALQTYHTTRTQLEAEDQVLQILTSAIAKMNVAVRAMDDARQHSRMDMFGGGTMSDMMERSALHKAENSSTEAQMLIMQAQRLSPHVSSVSRPQIAQGNIMSDVFFDNIFTDSAFHEKIKQSQVAVTQCAKAVDVEGQKTKSRIDDLRNRLAVQGKELEHARVALQKAREDAFARISGNKPY